MPTLYIVHAFKTRDGRPALEQMQRCGSLETVTEAFF